MGKWGGRSCLWCGADRGAGAGGEMRAGEAGREAAAPHSDCPASPSQHSVVSPPATVRAAKVRC